MAVVRVAEGTVVARATVTGVDRPFDLTVKDGTVWFNESGGAWAGVLGADGVVERVDKYPQVVVSANNGGGQPGQEQPNKGANTSGSTGENAGSATNPSGGDPASQPADGTVGGGSSQATGSDGGATGPTENTDLTGLVADFTYSKRVVEVGESVTFVDRSQGGPIAWTWDFADGSFSTGREASHSWDAVGAYRVTLRIESPTGTAAATATIEVIDENTRSRPNADFRFSASRVEVGQAVTFTDRSTGNATSLAWDFGDGNTGDWRGRRSCVVGAGTYQVALTATNALGSDTSEPATITVYDRVDQADGGHLGRGHDGQRQPDGDVHEPVDGQPHRSELGVRRRHERRGRDGVPRVDPTRRRTPCAFVWRTPPATARPRPPSWSTSAW